MKIRIGVGLSVGHVLATPADFCSVVDILEDLSFDSLWMSDTAVGRSFDPMTALAFAGGRTTRLRLGTNVAVLPGRDPFLIAKQMALIDQLSNGRLLPAFGLGSPSDADRPPFRVERGMRARSFEENLSIIRRLWADGGSVPHPDGGPPATIHPRPSRELDIWFGGRSTAALERTGRLGDGWIGNFQTPDEAGRARSIILDAAAAAGRSLDDDHFGVTIYYVRGRRSPFAEHNVMQSMQYCGCHSTDGNSTMPLRDEHVAGMMLPAGEDQLCSLISQHIDQGLSKFVLIPADRPASWDEELGWLRAVTAALEN